MPEEPLKEHYLRLREKTEREDIVMFINTCFAATNQDEYYANGYEQSVSIDFLHRYVLTNYRQVYARALAAGINHFNQAAIISNLLAAGAPQDVDQRREEGRLIAATLRQLPANRAYYLLHSLSKRRVNNRRTRAVVKQYLNWRKDPAFDAVKYRNKYRSTAAHVHIPLASEFSTFLFRIQDPKRFQTRLFDQYRQAQYSASALYELPFTVAESLAQRHGVPRDVFLKNIEPRMTAAEKLRYQKAAGRTKGARLEIDLGRTTLTRLFLYVLSLSVDERMDRAAELDAALQRSVSQALEQAPLSLGRVATVLDRSRSSQGSRAKRNRPLAVALGVDSLLRAASREYRPFWTPAIDANKHAFTSDAMGQSSLGEPLIDALEWQPELVVIVSDAHENDPPYAADQVAQAYYKFTDQPAEIVHVNPVFDSDHFSPRELGPSICTVGLRDAEDLATMLGFARFAGGTASLAELDDYLAFRTRQLLDSHDC